MLRPFSQNSAVNAMGSYCEKSLQYCRQVMFEKECEKAMFAQDPREHDMETLGFSREFEVRDQVVKIEEQSPTDYVLYHDLGEMWKRRQVYSQLRYTLFLINYLITHIYYTLLVAQI